MERDPYPRAFARFSGTNCTGQSLQEGYCYQTLTLLMRDYTSHRILSYPGIALDLPILELALISEERFAPSPTSCRGHGTCPA